MSENLWEEFDALPEPEVPADPADDQREAMTAEVKSLLDRLTTYEQKLASGEMEQPTRESVLGIEATVPVDLLMDVTTLVAILAQMAVEVTGLEPPPSVSILIARATLAAVDAIDAAKA